MMERQTLDAAAAEGVEPSGRDQIAKEAGELRGKKYRIAPHSASDAIGGAS